MVQPTGAYREPPFPLHSTPRTPLQRVGCHGHAYPSESPLPRRRHDLSPSQLVRWWWLPSCAKRAHRGWREGGGGQGGGLVVTRGIPTSGIRRVRDAREGRGTERDGEGGGEREREKKEKK